jgi:Fur family ferric uptake transcriptional regulator
MTPQRRIILEELRKVHSHPTADKVYEMVLRRLPRISLGTVYRNLEILSECGIIQKLELSSRQKRFDSNTENHYHLRCICCGRVDDAPIKPLTSLEESLKRVSDYRIMGHQLEFVGLCPDCKEKGVSGKDTRVNRKEGQ